MLSEETRTLPDLGRALLFVRAVIGASLRRLWRISPLLLRRVITLMNSVNKFRVNM